MDSDSELIAYAAGACPVCRDGGVVIFMIARETGRLFWMCPQCKCVWREPPSSEFRPEEMANPVTLAPQGFVPASRDQIAALDPSRPTARLITLDRPMARPLFADRITLELTNCDYEWVAFDADGYLGIFTTAGDGTIPSWFLEHRATFEWFMDRLDGLPVRGDHRFEVRGVFDKGRAFQPAGDAVLEDTPDTRAGFADWVRWARMGMFSFDWFEGRSLRSYALIAAPTNPLRWPNDSDPPTWGRLDGVRFARDRWVDVEWPPPRSK